MKYAPPSDHEAMREWLSDLPDDVCNQIYTALYRRDFLQAGEILYRKIHPLIKELEDERANDPEAKALTESDRRYLERKERRGADSAATKA